MSRVGLSPFTLLVFVCCLLLKKYCPQSTYVPGRYGSPCVSAFVEFRTKLVSHASLLRETSSDLAVR